MTAIDTNLLISWGATYKKYKKGEYIFYEGDEALFYYQVESGELRMSNMNDSGKEYIQGMFSKGESFGEPPLFLNETYPASAIANEDLVVLRISKEYFFKILRENTEIQFIFLKILAKKVYSKAITAKSVINHTPEERIMAFLCDYKRKLNEHDNPLQIPFTRQEIANYTGLRVETVIRTLSVMKSKNMIIIKDRKLFF
ncbi:MAG: Crp/Fnr family transcriptional regulator [Chitinophagaceae bacterium]|jgi:CRP-like cAMP-binding protein|nr:Crp/Fnr family transcriptional regulator [Bacteroidota bacterium]